MDSPVLVDRDIEAGKQLIAALDRHGVPIVAAFWQQQPESQVWRLVIASQRVNENGPLAVYQLVNDVLRLAAPPIAVRPEDVQVVGVFDGLVTQLMTFRGTDAAPFIGGTWVQHEAVGDVYVENMYLYRAEHYLKDGRIDVMFAFRDATSRKWKEVPGQIETTGGLVTSIASPGDVVKVRNGAHGVTARFTTVHNPYARKGQRFGRLIRWVCRDGRTWSMDVNPIPVRLEGPQQTSAA